MSDSFHVTIKDIRGLPVKELKKQSRDPDSDLASWAKKSRVKRDKIKSRKADKQSREKP